MTDPLDSPALDGSPGQAFASHKARANGIARFFAQTHPMDTINGKADEDKTITLLAHLHAASHEPDFAVGGIVSREHIPATLRRLNRGDGLVGTRHDYDMALKGLMTIAYRYPDLLGEGGRDFILNDLVPGGIRGGHPPEIEIVEVTFLNIDIPETENHLLMIESSRYLVNQLLHDRPPHDPRFDNVANGLSRWLLGYMQTIAKHDFLEFNSRPYARLSLHTLYNLHEFARDPEIRTAAHILLDYTMMKFAVSSNRGRRVSPFRRLQHRINHQANDLNDLYANRGDQVAHYFMAYTGYTDPEGKPGKFPPSLTFEALISGTAVYRPPTAAYILALKRDNPPSLHRFYHGTRPQLRGSSDIADGGLEIYYHSPSFLLSAGGSFLNSGYGNDEWDIGVEAWEQTSRAQATTLIPTRADTRFHDLIRFEPYPDPLVDPYADDPEDPDTLHARAVNIAVDRGLLAGANLRPAEKKTILEHATSTSPSLALHDDRLLMAWKGSGNDNLNVAKVLSTTLLGIDGVEGVEEVVTLADETDASPALESHNERVFLAWKGSGNDQLNLAFSEDNGRNFTGKRILTDESEYSPALISHGGRLLLAWTGVDEQLNVAKVSTIGIPRNGGWNADWFPAPVQAVFDRDKQHVTAVSRHQGQLDLFVIGFDNHIWTTFWTEPLTFEVFKRETLARNTTLPANLENGGHYAFNAPDGKRFAIWFALTELKYTARVVDLNDPNAIGYLNTLPLVSGEYMTSVGRHNGLIEIRHPGCDQVSVMLDYRNAERPVRSENRSGCPWPWIERTQALFAIAKTFEEQQRGTDGRTALVDAVQLYDELLRLKPEQNGPHLAPALIAALGRMGVDFSVPEVDLRDWLANPHFTPYPAISHALLLLGRRLKAQVFLDVIVWNYEHTPGVASPRNVADVKLDVLKAAILVGSNVRYGTNVSDFEQLLGP